MIINQQMLSDGWQMVRFDQIAEEIKEVVQVPSESGYDRFVGGDHLDSNDLKIRRWGSTDDVEAQKLLFKQGHVLFGKRNAYLRKAAYADFDGVCSAHMMVLQAKPDIILPEFFPFFMQTDMFWERALMISEGSMSPTIKWKILARQQFPLPPLDEQRRIAEILWAVEDAIDSYLKAMEGYESLEDAIFRQVFLNGLREYTECQDTIFGELPAHWRICEISDIADVAYGISEAVSHNTDPSLGWPILTSANITLGGQITLEKMNYIEEPTKPEFILEHGDLLLNWRSGSIEHVGKTAIFDLSKNYTFASFILRIRPIPEVSNVYLHRLLNFMRAKKLFGGATSQQVNFKMNASMVRRLPVIVPPVSEQQEIVNLFLTQENSKDSLNKKINSLKSLKRSLLIEILA